MGCINSTNKSFSALKRDDVFNVSVLRVQSDQLMGLSRHGFLEVTPQELVFSTTEEEPVTWSLQHLRRYGLTGNVFSFEAGRRCSTGAGIYSFICQNADQFYARFQRCINSLSLISDRNSREIQPSHIFTYTSNRQMHANHYLERTSQVIPFDESLVLSEYLSNDSNEFNYNSPDSVQSPSLTSEIIHLPTSAASFLNIPSPSSSTNIYMKQPIRVNNEYNNNISSQITDSSRNKYYKSVLQPLLKSSSLDIPPQESAPILSKEGAETQKLYENIEVIVSKSTSACQNKCSNSRGRFYANVEFLSTRVTHVGQSRSYHLDFVIDQQKPTATNAKFVNYIVLDLNKRHSPSKTFPKNSVVKCQFLSGSGDNFTCFKNDEFSSNALSCGSSTIPKRSTISGNNLELADNKIESSGSYTRIDFLKTLALMKSSTNVNEIDLENEHEESRITRHSKFVRKAYSISE